MDLTSKLAQRLAQSYDLKHRTSFGGWYLPVEVANFRVTVNDPARTWPMQLNKLTKSVVTACRSQVDKPVAVSPYFNSRLTNGKIPVFQGGNIVNGSLPDWLDGPDAMRKNYTTYLSGTGISIVMLQDGVGERQIGQDDVVKWVTPYLASVEQACKDASPNHGPPIEFWLNVESFVLNDGNRSPCEINRLQAQMALWHGHAGKVVTFEFTNYLGQAPLYGNYLKLPR